MEPVVRKILNIAKMNKVSDQAICRRLNANRNKVDDWKKEKSTPSLGELCILADYFNVTVDYLLGRDTKVVDIPPGKNPAPGDSLAEDEKRLIDGYRELNEEGRKVLADIAVSLVSGNRYTKNA